jgi:uncharacterized protein
VAPEPRAPGPHPLDPRPLGRRSLRPATWTAALARLPVAGLRLVDGSAWGSTNARSALAALRLAVADRSALAPRETEQPGWLSEIPRDEALTLLAGRTLGRLAYVGRAGQPDVVPVNYTLDGEDVLFRTGPGPKLQAAEREDVVAFEVDDVDEQARSGWSVVVVGRARLEPVAPDAGRGPEPWAGGPRRHLVRIVPVRVTGRRLPG